MAITVVNDYSFKPDDDLAEGKAAAAELVEYFKADVPEVQLSLWLEDRDNPSITITSRYSIRWRRLSECEILTR